MGEGGGRLGSWLTSCDPRASTCLAMGSLSEWRRCGFSPSHPLPAPGESATSPLHTLKVSVSPLICAATCLASLGHVTCVTVLLFSGVCQSLSLCCTRAEMSSGRSHRGLTFGPQSAERECWAERDLEPSTLQGDTV